MSSRLRRLLVVTTAGAAALSAALPATAAPAANAPGTRTTLDAAPAWTHTARAAGATAAATPVRLAAVLPLRDAVGAERLALAVSTPGDAQYGQYLTAAQWRARFAPTDATVGTVTGWLRSHGFTVGSVPANHRYVAFTGTAAAANAAFGVGLTNYVKDGARVSAPSAAVTVPAELAAAVAGIAGLDTSARMTPTHTTDPAAAGPPNPRPNAAGPPNPRPNEELPPPGAVFRNAPPFSDFFGQKVVPNVPEPLATPLTYAVEGYTPGQLRSAYGLAASQSVGLDGRGATVAIVDAYASPTIFSDATTYAARNDSRHPLRSFQFRQLLPATFTDTVDCDAQGWYGEETLDVEAVHGTAPAANILYAGASSCNDTDIVAAVNSIVDNDLAQIISNSYGNQGEPPLADVLEEHQTYIQAAAQGISVLFSSGDAGDNIETTGTRQPDYPAADPFVTAVGGTALGVGNRGQYLFETGWGNRRSVLTDGAWTPFPGTFRGGGGGGTSFVWGQPAYQRGVVPAAIANINGNGPHRAVPDLALLGDPNTGFLVGQTQQFPDGTFKYSQYRIGGTSLSCPLLAGIQAVANQVARRSLGFLNPTVYRLAGTPAFRDIRTAGVTSGVVRVDYVNGADDTDGTITSLRTLNETGTIFARPGYDDVTGVGTPNGAAYLLGVALASRAHHPAHAA
jgi:subtilase family serine protease